MHGDKATVTVPQRPGETTSHTFAATAGSAAVEYVALLTMIGGLAYLTYAVLAGQAGHTISQAAQTAALAVTLLAACALVLDRRRRKNAADLHESGLPASLQPSFVEKRQQILRILTGHARRQPGESVTVRHLMTTKLRTISPATTVQKLSRLMHQSRIHHLLVVHGERDLVGVISDRDVAHRRGRAAADIMTHNPLSVTPDTPAIQAITMMMGARFSCMPVAENGKLVGLLTTTDLMMALQCTLQIMSQSLQSSKADAPAEVRGARYFTRLEEEAEEATEEVVETANA
jgi:CBS domain-containing protein